MRARIISLIILIVLLGLPLFAYWYFMVREESLLIISPTKEGDFSVELYGTLEYSYLPLADKFLKFRTECHGTCTLGPIPPVTYEVVISSTGNITSSSRVQILAGSPYNLTYESLPDIIVTQFDEPLEGGAPVLSNEYSYLSHIGGNILVWKKGENESSLGVLSGESFRSIRQLPSDIKNARMDHSHEYILLEGVSSTLILSKDFLHEIEFPLSLGIPTLISRYNENWNIHTISRIYENHGNNWEQNLRFTDTIDISPYSRIGYIASSDNDRLSLGNFLLGEGVLISLDRKTGKSYVLRRGIDIEGFFYVSGKPAYIDKDGKEYLIEYNK